ncbi:MAG: nucleotide exchange factor GrpE [Acidobacteriota bacterium]
MDPNHELENFNEHSVEVDAGETVSVDDFIKELEAKEKDLHIASDASVIEIEDSFDDSDDMPDIMREAMAARGTEAAAEPAVVEPEAVPRDAGLPATVAQLREQIEKMEADRNEQFKNSQRRARDFETYKARTERERTETYQTQIGNLATQMLPAFDNLNRALDFAMGTADEKGAEFKQFYEGIVLVNQQIYDVFERMGLTQIPTVGTTFDPHLHEAVATEINNGLAPNTISEELLRGYRIGEKVLRHSMVKVSQVSKERPETEPAETVPSFHAADGEDAVELPE